MNECKPLIVEPGKEASFEYRFSLDPQLAGHDFTLALTAFYQDDNELYASTFFNSTVPVLDPVGVFDTQSFFMYIALLGRGLHSSTSQLNLSRF